MSYVTMATLESDIRTRYDVEGFTARHPQAQIFRWINDAIRDFRERITADGGDTFLSMTGETCSAIGPTTSGTGVYPGTILSGAGGFFTFCSMVRGVYMKNGSSWIPLKEISFEDALTRSDLSSNSVPQYWCLAGVDVESDGSVSPTETDQGLRIMVVPPNDVSREFRIHGLMNRASDLTTSGRIMTDFGLHEYAIRYCGVLLANRDDDVNLWQARKAELQECYADLSSRCRNRAKGCSSRVDTRTRGRTWPR